MNMKTYRQLLEETQTAIETVLRGQRYEIDGRVLWRADLQWLNQREKFLIGKIDQVGPDAVPGTQPKRGAFRVSFT